MSATATVPTAVVHIGADGEPHYASTEGCRLLVIDERAPTDRVYECSRRLTPAGLNQLVAGSPIGRIDDGRSDIDPCDAPRGRPS